MNIIRYDADTGKELYEGTGFENSPPRQIWEVKDLYGNTKEIYKLEIFK